MANNSFNAQNGFSAGLPAIQVIDGQGNFVNNSSSSTFGNITANSATIGNITSAVATVGNITANSIVTTIANATTATISTINTNSLTASSATITGATVSGNLLVVGQLDATTYDDPFVSNSSVVTTGYMHYVTDWEESSIPLQNITGGFYSFASTGTGLTVNVHTAGGSVTSANVVTGGTRYYTGDLISLKSGKYDAILRVTSQSGGTVGNVEVLFGGSFYANGILPTAPADPIAATYTLSGTLTSDATLVMPAGTYTENANQWNLINNTASNNFNIAVKLSNGLGGTIGNGITIIRGTQNSRITLALTDGVSDVYSINGQTYLAYTNVVSVDPNALVANFNPPFYTLVDGLTVGIGASHINTLVNPTLTVNGLGPYPIKKGTNDPLLPGDIGGPNHEMLLTFNAGTQTWVLQNPTFGVGTIGIQYADIVDYQYFTISNIIGNLITKASGNITYPFGERVYQSPDGTWANAVSYGNIVSVDAGNLTAVIEGSTFKSNSVSLSLNIWHNGNIYGNVSGAHVTITSANTIQTTDTLKVSYPVAYHELLDGLTIGAGAQYINQTSTPTLNVDGLGVRPIVKGANHPVIPGDINGANHEMLLTYNAGIQKWVLQNPNFGVGTIGVQYADATGTSDALVMNFSTPYSVLIDGLTIGGGAQFINQTSSPTLNVDGLGAFPIVKGTNKPLIIGDIGGADHEMLLTFNLGTHTWVLQNPIYGTSTTGMQYADVNDYQYFYANLTHVGTGGNVWGFNTEYTIIDPHTGLPVDIEGEVVYQSPDGTWANATARGIIDTISTVSGNVLSILNSVFTANGATNFYPIWHTGQEIIGNVSGARANLYSFNETLTADTLYLEYLHPYSALVDGLTIGAGAQYVNTTSNPTLNVDNLGTFPIVKGANSPLSAGDISGTNHEMILTFNLGIQKWVLQNPIFGVGTIGVQYIDATGTSDALVMNFPIPYKSLFDGLTVGGGAHAINLTATPTLTVDGHGPYPIKKGTNNPLLAGDIGGPNHEMLLTFNAGTQTWVLQNPTFGVGTIGVQYMDVDDYQHFTANTITLGTGGNVGGFKQEYSYVDSTGTTIIVPGETVYQSPDGTWANATASGMLKSISTVGSEVAIIIEGSMTGNGNVAGTKNSLTIWHTNANIRGTVTGAVANLYSFGSITTTDSLYLEYPIPYKKLFDGLTIGAGAQYINQTATPTLAVDGQNPAGVIVKGTNNPLIPGDIGGPNHEMLLTYNGGTNTWVLQNPIFGIGTVGVQYIDAQDRGINLSDALIVNYPIPYKALFDGLTVGVGTLYPNKTTTPTMNVDGHGAATITRNTGAPLMPGDIGGANHEILFTYNAGTGTWALQNPINTYSPNAVVYSGQTSTSANTGALIVTGGTGVSGNVNVGGKLNVIDTASITGAASLSSTLSVAGTTTANVINAAGIVTISNGTDSNGTASGALVVNGGMGVVKTGYFGGDVHILGNLYAANTISTSTTTTSVLNTLLYLGQANPAPYNFDIGMYSHVQDTFSGLVQYVGMARNHANDYWVFFSNANTSPTANTTINFTEANIIYDTIQAGGLLLQNTTVSTSTTTGALRVSGGVGVAGTINAASVYTDNLRFANGISYGSSTFAPSTDITASSPSGFNTSFTLTPTGVTGGIYGSATLIPSLTVDSKGRITAVTTSAVTTSFGVVGTTGTGSVSTPSGSLTFASSNGFIASANGSTVTLSTPQDLRTTASPTFGNVNATTAVVAPAVQIGTGSSAVAGQLVLSNGVRIYTAAATDGLTLYSDIRHNPASGSLSISSKGGPLYLNRENGTGGVVFSNGANGTVGTVDGVGNANFVGALTQNGNQVLHATNYTNYAPSITGTGASGTWGINISGSAAFTPAAGITGTTLPASIIASSLTSVGTLANLTVSGTTVLNSTVNAGTINASTINAGIIGNVGTILNGTLNTSAQPNITTIGTLAALTVTGNVGIGGAASLAAPGGGSVLQIGPATSAGGVFGTFAGGNGIGIWSGAAIPSISNYSFWTNSTNSEINGQINARLSINGTPIAVASSTGLAVTGTGAFSAPIGKVDITSTTGVAYAWVSLTNTGGTSYIALESGTGAAFGATAYDMVLAFAATRGLTVVNGGSPVARFSGTGLAVTGTGAFSASTGNILSMTAGIGTNAAYMSFSNTGGSYYAGADNSTGTTLGSGAPYDFVIDAPNGRGVTTSIGFTPVTRVSSIGLAVTGTLSASAGLIVTNNGATITGSTNITAPAATVGWAGLTVTNPNTAANSYVEQVWSCGGANSYIWQASPGSTAWGGPSSLNFQSQADIKINTSGGTGTGAVRFDASNGLILTGPVKRAGATAGYLDGQFPSVETVNTPGCIYTIGGLYQPTATTTGNMYGIGYGSSGNAGITGSGAPTGYWGFYTAANGTARIFLAPELGNGYFSGSIIAGANGSFAGTLGAGATTVTTLVASSSTQLYSLGVGTGATGVAGQIVATNSITAFYSDRRLKTITGKIENALDKIDQLAGILYTQNALAEEFGYNDYAQQVGVIAQDVQKVQPEAVKLAPFDMAEDGTSKSGENYLTVQYEKLVPLLIEGIKELRAEINMLKGKQ
ncbi:MAG TPA: tail fiber domain-containing protein [Methanosarcina sp.]|nr:tail fiber domain-containing protein [Methanosarcina sp.]